MQRVRIGLTGLAIVFLLVLLTTALLGLATRESTIHTDANGKVVTTAPAPTVNAAEPPKEPLAELGVTPGHSEPAAQNSATTPPAPPPATH